MKKLVVFFLLMAASMAVKADYLYWMVSDEYGEAAGESSADPYASLYVVTSSGNVSLDSRSALQVYTAWDIDGSFSVDISNYASDSYTFYIELWNGMKTEASSYSSLVSNGYVYQGGVTVPNAVSASGFGYSSTYAVPEPTSGLLFLVGGMLLGLKRRRQV